MTVAWIVWIVAFFALEVPAILNARRGDTLSEQFWRWFHVYDDNARGKLGRFVLLVFTCWLVVHFIGGGRLM